MTEVVNIFVIDDSEDDRLLYRRALQKLSEEIGRASCRERVYVLV